MADTSNNPITENDLEEETSPDTLWDVYCRDHGSDAATGLRNAGPWPDLPAEIRIAIYEMIFDAARVDIDLRLPSWIECWTRKPRPKYVADCCFTSHVAFTGSCRWIRTDASMWYWERAVVQAAEPRDRSILYFQAATEAIDETIRDNAVHLRGVTFQTIEEIREVRARTQLPQDAYHWSEMFLPVRDTVVEDNDLLLAKWPQLRTCGIFHQDLDPFFPAMPATIRHLWYTGLEFGLKCPTRRADWAEMVDDDWERTKSIFPFKQLRLFTSETQGKTRDWLRMHFGMNNERNVEFIYRRRRFAFYHDPNKCLVGQEPCLSYHYSVSNPARSRNMESDNL